ncbi:MAG: APC family permease [Elusimicrobiota bacterium]
MKKTSENPAPSWIEYLKTWLIGAPRNLQDKAIFHNLSLIAFFAWVGLGADGLSSSCYGPEEMFLALKGHVYLAVFVAALSVTTIFVISASYSQIIELFPSGGGGYLVASKLLSPTLGMVSGCALIVDYVLTITISIASGADALFSFLPTEYLPYKLFAAFAGVGLLIWMNLRGVKESIIPLVPIFMVFILTHAAAILYALIMNAKHFPAIASGTVNDIQLAYGEIGAGGLFFLLIHAYSMGAGTYTGIEAVSNGLPILREPRVATAKRTMNYMAYSLAIAVMGLVLAYLLYGVQHQPGKTLNAVLFENITQSWPGGLGTAFVMVTLLSETALLFIAAQAGFLDGPRVVANMANDRWMPTSFATLSDRFVTRNGVVLMGTAALLMMIVTGGSVRLLVVLYAINVFITFVLSQAGMVKHWWREGTQTPGANKKLLINGVGLALSAFILCSVVFAKFNEGAWVTLIMTGGLIALAAGIKQHYKNTAVLLKRLDNLVHVAEESAAKSGNLVNKKLTFNPKAKTAVVMVNGYNGLGLHTLFNIIRFFGDTFKNFVFVQIGVVDAENFKGAQDLERLEAETKISLGRYINFMNKQGFYAEARHALSNDVVDEIEQMTGELTKRFGQIVFFGGQLVFPNETFFTRALHGYKVFALQRRLYQNGIPLFIVPIRV